MAALAASLTNRSTTLCSAPPSGLAAGREIADRFLVEVSRLPAAGIDAPVGRQIGMDCHQSLLQCDHADQMQEERLAGPIVADDQSERRALVGDAIDVAHRRRHFIDPPDLNMLQTGARHDAGTQRLNDGVAVAGADR